MAPLILIADDFPDAREMYGGYLEHAGYRVVSAQDGIEAVAKSRHLQPDLVVMDLLMPRMDGFEATRRLKLDAETEGIPIVALTGALTGRVAEKAMDAGCDEFLTKPCLPSTLLERIERHLARLAEDHARPVKGRRRKRKAS